ncbi:autotransporter outer membrane beta-barrel domain-containing protein [Paraherbaspirillum soli]|uniref:Autotransporter outer membrane beta-barrel domain-containing protein n=1 Tax=Paraherbaspirillum soli TaxID=631222 RepID=A0ABW0MBJ5_9BURK
MEHKNRNTRALRLQVADLYQSETTQFQRRERNHAAAAMVLLAAMLVPASAWANCSTAGVITTCDAAAPNPFANTVGQGPASATGASVTLNPNAQIVVGDANAISLGDNATIKLSNGAIVQSTAVSANGLYATGGNTVEFGNNSTLQINAGAQILANGTQGSAEAINVEGTGNTITNDGTIKAQHATAIWFQNVSGRNAIINNATGVIQAPGNVIGGSGNGAVDFTNRGTVIGDLVFAGGDDALHLYTGSTITGSFDGGGGTNSISLNGAGMQSMPGAIKNFQTLVKNDSGTWELTGSITGVTAAEVAQGTLILSGNNAAYTGSVLVEQPGILQARAQSLPPTITDNGLVRFTQADAATYAGQISGTGAVEKNGAGTLTLAPAAGNNTYSGGTFLNQGTLAVAADNVLGAASGGLTFNGGTLQLNRGFDLAASRAIVLNAGGGTIDTQSFNSNIAQGISGIGGLTKAGQGTLTLTADNTYTGGTTVTAGTLAVGDAAHPNAALSGGGATTIAATGTLGGYGSVKGAVTNNGTISVANALAASATGPNGSFTINGNLINSGLVNIGGNGVGNALRVTGNYVGQNGSISLNTYLGKDGSPSDRLVIDGGTASGSSKVKINNVGGSGAITSGNGILVVDAVNGGSTAASAFKLAAPVVVGPYEYTLYRGSKDSSAPQSWYLRSESQTPITRDVNDGTPKVPGIPTTNADGTPIMSQPDYRKEVSLYTAIPSMSLLYGRSLLDTLHERVGELRAPGGQAGNSSGNGAWARAIGKHGSDDGARDGIYSSGPGFNYNISALQAGVDFYRSEHADHSRDYAGIYAATGWIDGDVQHVSGMRAGQDTIDTTTLGAYWTHIGAAGWYLDGVLQRSWYEVSAASSRLPSLRTDGVGIAASVEGGYPLQFGNGLVIEPQAQLVYQKVKLNSASDVGADVSFADADSLAARVGARIAKSIELDSGTTARMLTTWLRANLWHEFRGDAKTGFSSTAAPVSFQSDLGGSWLELTGGVTAQVTQAVSVFGSVGYDKGIGSRHSRAYDGKVGVRLIW